MEALPDDALLEVMQYLDIADLLACRLVCRRLGSLALLPELWRHHSIDIDDVYPDDGEIPRYSICAVLRLAPCLRSWHVCLPEKYHTMFATTRCAVNKLTLWMRQVDGKGALQASLLIRNQEALGRLRRLSLGLGNAVVYYCVKDTADAYELLGTVASTSRLEELSITGFQRYPQSTLAGLDRSFLGASLKSFEHDPRRPDAEPFCQFILSTHASTLESIDLDEHAQTSTSTATLLAGMPNLRSLRCGMMPGLEAVAGCELLRDLDLCVAYDGEARAAAEFLRRATQLVKLTLRYDESKATMVPAPSPDMDFLLALAATGRSHLEELEIYVDIWEHHYFPQQQALLKALPRLPALKLLNVEARTEDDILLGITPANAPSLRTLQVFRMDLECSHDALHRDAVQKCLSLNPELKLITYAPIYCYRDDRCAWCLLGCHQEMRDDSDPERVDYVTIPRI
ncbi:uncharacterized protein LOC113202787 [Frankliniella occidentalis]|uniref:Uncharacterized protein LOC113202787 n=1 Tax=Frankliniella occidentalis TaxID=133901 RepID=A0A6J1RVG7_FRAOC|nr:uncharacterized protein LOC113202787 [Frankliniella occidentalis]